MKKLYLSELAEATTWMLSLLACHLLHLALHWLLVPFFLLYSPLSFFVLSFSFPPAQDHHAEVTTYAMAYSLLIFHCPW